MYPLSADSFHSSLPSHLSPCCCIPAVGGSLLEVLRSLRERPGRRLFGRDVQRTNTEYMYIYIYGSSSVRKMKPVDSVAAVGLLGHWADSFACPRQETGDEPE